MEILKEIVRAIALIIIFAGFMEMLLPDSDMRRFIKVIVGLFVIVSVVTPVARFINEENTFEVASWQYTAQDNTKEVIERGQKIAQQAQKTVATEGEKRIAAQINALAKLHTGVESASVELTKGQDGTSTKVGIKITTEHQMTEEEKNQLRQEVSETITAFFEYPLESIEIVF